MPELVPIRYGRMLVSPFTFYRGAAYLMASDLAGMPRTGLHTQLCGDAHLSNFGGFAAPDRRLVFSVNDFDETLPGPFEWDVKRLVASFEVAARDRGFDDATREKINREVSRSYREWIQKTARDAQPRPLVLTRRRRRRSPEVWQRDASPKAIERFEKNVAKARTKDSLKAFEKLTQIVDGEPRIIADPPVIVPIEDLAGDQAHSLDEALHNDPPFVPEDAPGRPAQAARAVPVHPRRAQGRRGGKRRDTRVHLPDDGPRRRRPVVPPVQGGPGLGARAVPRQERVRQPRAAGRRGAAADAGRERHHARLDPHDGLRRRRSATSTCASSGTPRARRSSRRWSPQAMLSYATVCGGELARCHARAGDGVAIASYLGKTDTFDRALATFARRTPTRTSATTSPSRKPSTPGG